MVDVQDGILRVLIDREYRRNALSGSVRDELREAFTDCAGNRMIWKQTPSARPGRTPTMMRRLRDSWIDGDK